MELNLNENYIEFLVIDDNMDRKVRIALTYMFKKYVYKFGISMCESGDCFELIGFQHSLK